MSQLTKEEIQYHREQNNNRRENALRNKAMSDSIKRLVNNPDFISVIEKGFCGSEMQNYICNSVTDTAKVEDREDSLQMALAAGRLSVWLSNKIRLTNSHHSELVACDEQDDYLNSLDQ